MSDRLYDEQFRRGYAGPPISPPAAPTPERIAPVRAPTPPTAQTASPMSHQVDELEAALPSANAHSDGVAIRPDADGQERRRNPFSIGLLAFAVLMVIVGVWMIWTSSAQNSGGISTYEQQAVILAEGQLAPPLLTGGVIAIIAWLVLGAIAASARKRGE